MKKILKLTAAAFTVASLFVACNDEDITENDSNNIEEVSTEEELATLTLNIDNLEALGDDFLYEGWLTVNNQTVSTGRFSDTSFPKTFKVNKDKLKKATSFEITIEPKDENEAELLTPENTKIIAGNFEVDEAIISSNNSVVSSRSVIDTFEKSWGKYILATPTDGGADTNEESGIWFLDNSNGSNEVGLGLPTLSTGWQYEGWVVINGKAISTGTFTNVNGADSNASNSPFKGTVNNGPSFPGEDFLMGSAAGIDFATDLRGATVVISIEPNPDNSPEPFLLKPLSHVIPLDAPLHTAINMDLGPVVKISGKVTR